MTTHLILYRVDRRLKGMTKSILPFVPVAACQAKYSVMAQLKRKPKDITCPKCKARAIEHERFDRWLRSKAGKTWRESP